MEIKAVVTEIKSGEAQSSSSETMVSYKQYPISIKVVRKDQFFMPNSTYHYQVNMFISLITSFDFTSLS